MTTYSALVAAIKSYTNNEDTERFYPEIPEIINRVELQISKRLDITAEVITDVTNDPITTGTAFVAKPLLWRAAYQFRLIPTDGTDAIFLDFRTRSFCDLFWPDKDKTDTPRFYCEFSDNSLKIVPSLDKSYTGEHSYEAFITGLSSSRQETWLSLNAPDLLFKGCLAEAAIFMKNSAMLALYEKEFNEALEDENTQDVRQKLDNLSLSRM